MSNFDLDFSCIEEFQGKIEKLGKKVSKIEDKALEAGAEPILQEMISKCPVRTGKARSHLKASKPKKIKGVKTVKIGINKEDNSEAFYLKFYEYGTSRGQIARPFMRPAFENKRKKGISEMAEVIRKELKNEHK